MAWNLRPFLGDRNQPFHLIGRYQGNFYAAVVYAVKQLATDSAATVPQADSPAELNLQDLLRLGDTAAAPGTQP
ncbi:MAG: hypothetical protein L0191_08020, partial [Acidobacteria bacterium]|nr:hypothetical protein [Acidobacteriota bacterium]